jgi:hypothetical protein
VNHQIIRRQLAGAEQVGTGRLAAFGALQAPATTSFQNS